MIPPLAAEPVKQKFVTLAATDEARGRRDVEWALMVLVAAAVFAGWTHFWGALERGPGGGLLLSCGTGEVV